MGEREGDARGPARTRTWIVDAFNVLGARPDGWWRNRMLALAQLCDAIARWPRGDDEVVVVVDGWPKAEVPERRSRGVDVRYAHRRGPDGADRAIIELLEGTADLAAVTVVTSDADLRTQVRRLGARVEGAGTFRDRIEAS
jgi:hypothetical protein